MNGTAMQKSFRIPNLSMIIAVKFLSQRWFFLYYISITISIYVSSYYYSYILYHIITVIQYVSSSKTKRRLDMLAGRHAENFCHLP